MSQRDKFYQWINSWEYAFEEYGAQAILLWEINESLKVIAEQIKEKNDKV